LPEGVNNQQYFAQDLPAADKGHVEVRIGGLQPGDYTSRVTQVGYRKNDAYTAWLAMGSPAQLTPDQVAELKATASGAPTGEQNIRVDADGAYEARLPLRENDVYLIELIRK
jgi:xylan 1,4-beta-xylosidase